jgi:myo-inositol 2-dehydrogenase/D-chiro-inositol 1-dehydrogenase
MRTDIRKIYKIIDRAKKVFQEKVRESVRAAFVGCGKHATENLYPALKYAPINLVSVCAQHLQNAQRCALSFGAEYAYDDYREMLDNDKIDCLIVCVNPKMHYEISKEALNRGIPVFVEKPPASNSIEAKELMDLSNSVNKFLMVGFNKRFGAIYREARRIIETHAFGKLNSIFMSVNVGETDNKENFFQEVGIHYIDLLRYFGGEVKISQVNKKIEKNKAIFIISFEFKDGALGSLQLSNLYSWSKPSEYIEILGEENLLILDNAQKIIHHKPTIASPGEIPKESEKSTVWFPNYSIPTKENHLIFLNGYVYELRHFTNVVRNKGKWDSSIEDGHKALSIIDIILENEEENIKCL